ncbi:response regulator [Bordetella holmesii ATCC 51541]|nr:response regulator [Bordetella holmesii ATCC 51541]
MKQPAVLVIEDHPVQRLVIVRALEMLGYTRVLQAQEGSQALEQLALHGVADIVICDVRTPGMDGTQFLRESSQRNLVKSVILSSDVPSDLTAAILHMASLSGIQVLGDLGKPLNLGRLESLLRRYESDSSTAPGNAQTRPKIRPAPTRFASVWIVASSSPITSPSSTCAHFSPLARRSSRAGFTLSAACSRRAASSKPSRIATNSIA